ncbi:MAG: hypothetical protein LBR73_06990 [Oscillospiraceae bacterium]|jgi:hypothetical protein|nr:hypothetical protein [Oscillospiraceae bacterium]
MMNGIDLRVFYFLISAAVIALLLWLQSVTALHRTKRVRQAVLSPLSFVFAAVGIVLLYRYYDNVTGLLAFVPFFQDGGIAAENAALLLGFLLLKGVFLPVVSAIWQSNKRIEQTCSAFYEYDEQYSMWFVSRKCANLCPLLMGFVAVGGIVTAVLGGLTWSVGPTSDLWLLMFPAAATLVLNEVRMFFGGFTKQGYESAVLGENPESRRISSFYKLREIYEKQFGGNVLHSRTAADALGKNSAAQLLSELEKGDFKDRLCAKHFSLLGKRFTPDTDYVEAANRLLHKQSLVFFDPFYKDLGHYLALPLADAVLSQKKCLVICGRNSTLADVEAWLREVLGDCSRIDALWRTEVLGTRPPACEVGILGFANLYDNEIMRTNAAFFAQTAFVLLIEPSRVVGTGQLGFSLIADEIRKGGGEATYCICDRRTDGLLDTMSHLLRTELVEAAAAPNAYGIHSSMGWNADGDYRRQELFEKDTRFFGNGIELAAVAIKNQIPQVKWYSETKSPVRDIKWIAGQYTQAVCGYMNLPSQQKNLYDKITFIPTLWQAPVGEEEFLIAEDEYCNLFLAVKAFLSRGSAQVFANILSENYILRDYMRTNEEIFLTNPNAVPSLVADYAKTARNTVLRLILLMSARSVTKEELVTELHLAGIKAGPNVFRTFADLVNEYTGVSDDIFRIVELEPAFCDRNACPPYAYFIDPEAFRAHFAHTLGTAFFIPEDEESNRSFLDAKHYGHVTQALLPGQFVVYDGKYYLVKRISPAEGVILRRASDLYDGRKYYRQIRSYTFQTNSTAELTSLHTMMDVEIAHITVDYTVETGGYLEMRSNENLRSARLIDYSRDPDTSVWKRSYKRKDVLRLLLPGLSAEARFTVCLLLSEMFRSVFPDMWPYLAVTCMHEAAADDAGFTDSLVYALQGAEEPYIYIIEDSEIDLGLLGAVERNLVTFLEIVADYLDWHFEPEEEQPPPPPTEPGTVQLPPDEKKQTLWNRFKEWFGKVFRRKPKEEEFVEVFEESGEPEDGRNTAEDSDRNAVAEDGRNAAEGGGRNTAEDSDRNAVAEGGRNAAATEAEEEPPFEVDDVGIASGSEETERRRTSYLKFGFDAADSRLKLEEVLDFLRLRGFSDNALARARNKDLSFDPPPPLTGGNQCDFCGASLSGVSFDVLADGRLRCLDCAASAISSPEEYKEIFRQIKHLMEGFFNIKFSVGIGVKITDAHTVNRGFGKVFKPTSGFDPRVLGYAQRRGNRYSMVIENGSPRNAFIATMAHELTHIWQYIRWDSKQMEELYGTGSNHDIVYEGMAMWTEIQYLYLIGEESYAALQERNTEQRDDAYGKGFCLFREKYPLIKNHALIKFSPFSVFPPI